MYGGKRSVRSRFRPYDAIRSPDGAQRNPGLVAAWKESRITLRLIRATRSCGLADDCALAPERVQAPGAGAGKSEIEKDEAVEDGGVAAVEDREKSARRVTEKIR